MKVLIFGKNCKDIESLVLKKGFDVVTSDPELVLAYGGDGTLMLAESKFPGVPKALLRETAHVCKKCLPYSTEEVLGRIKNAKYKTLEIIKLEAACKGKSLYAINDIILHNKDPRHAIRYLLSVDGTLYGEEIIGDGVVVATPFGSTAYYKSITDSFFEVGIGVAFNNSTQASDHMVLSDDKLLKIKIVRGPAVVYADNQEDFIKVEKDEEVVIKKSKLKARIVTLE